VAIDLPDVGNGLGKSAVEINSGNVRSVNVASRRRDALVLNLRQPTSYRTELQGKSLLICSTRRQRRARRAVRHGSRCISRQPERRAAAAA
jgi:hypothetical protein